jgi:hypothetical protein
LFFDAPGMRPPYWLAAIPKAHDFSRLPARMSMRGPEKITDWYIAFTVLILLFYFNFRSRAALNPANPAVKGAVLAS